MARDKKSIRHDKERMMCRWFKIDGFWTRGVQELELIQELEQAAHTVSMLPPAPTHHDLGLRLVSITITKRILDMLVRIFIQPLSTSSTAHASKWKMVEFLRCQTAPHRETLIHSSGATHFSRAEVLDFPFTFGTSNPRHKDERSS